MRTLMLRGWVGDTIKHFLSVSASWLHLKELLHQSNAIVCALNWAIRIEAKQKEMGYNTIIVLIILCCLAPVTNQQGKPGTINNCFDKTIANYPHHTNSGVNLLWRGIQYPNNSILYIEEIGEGEYALVCQTDRRPCCGIRPYRFGEWYYPNGSRVPIEGAGATFYRNRSTRDDGQVLLNRQNHVTDYSSGLFCCVLPDASNVNHTLCIGLLPIGNITGKSS